MATPEFAATRYYAMAFLMPAVTVTYLPIWLNDRGISDAEIGLLNTVPMVGLLLMSLWVGRIADRAADWKQTIIAGTGLSALFSLFLGLSDGFWLILALWTLTVLPAGLVQPVGDAATIRMSMRLGFSFGTTRAWGTVGYLVMCFITGYVILYAGAEAFLWLVAATSAARFFAALALPSMRDVGGVRSVSTGMLLSTELREALRPWVLLPMIGGAILFANHMIMNAFSSLVWKEQGLSEPVIGLMIAIGAMAEAATMFAWSRISRRFPARSLIGMAAIASILRWAAMTLSPPLPVIVLMQISQSVTFTFAFLGCLYFIAKRTDESVAAEAQSLFGIMMQGFSILIVTMFGVVFGLVGVQAFWISVWIAVLALMMVQISFRLQSPEPG